VVGIDGSPAGDKAVAFAFVEAALHEAGLVAVHAWTIPSARMPAAREASVRNTNRPAGLAQGEERLLAEVLAGHRERYPDVTVRQEGVHGGAREALIEESRSARLMVVGARGRGGFAGLLLGSVSQALMHHAHCPVAVVRGVDEHH
jgi:nucleotide-binding universal stress UspA family protein